MRGMCLFFSGRHASVVAAPEGLLQQGALVAGQPAVVVAHAEAHAARQASGGALVTERRLQRLPLVWTMESHLSAILTTP